MTAQNPYRTVGPSDVDGATEDVLRSAVEARDLIAEAKAEVMRRHGLEADQAFELLRHYSRAWDRPLRDVALKVVHGTWVADA